MVLCWRTTRAGFAIITYRVALNFCRSLILRMGDFLCFAETNFCDWEKLVFFMGINFCDFQEVVLY